MTLTARIDVWNRQAEQWSRVGPPLRPVAEDGRILEDVAAELARQAPPRVLVLGVTPEMAGLSWPADTELLAVDRSEAMIGAVWPGFPRPGEGARQDDWRTMRLPPGSRDLVVGDGIFTVLSFPDDAHAVFRVVRDVLSPRGRFAFRTFVRPDETERPSDVHEAALAGEIGSFHAYKLRLLMSVQDDVRSGARTGDVWRAWHESGPGVEALAAHTGWSPEAIATIDAYRDQDTVLTFPTRRDLDVLAANLGFVEVACRVPTYDLGKRCPTVVLACSTTGKVTE